jgi:hypothetical protein
MDSSNGTYLDEVLGFLFILVVIGMVLSNLGFSTPGIFGQNDQQNNNQIGVGPTGLAGYFPIGEIKLGKDAINKADSLVHQIPSGRIVGEQLKREVGKIIEGPVMENGIKWWRVDYKKAPDGWIAENNLTEHVWQYRLLNIFPIIFGSITPFMILLSIILLILIVVVSVKNRSLQKLKQKKLDLARGKNVIDDIRETAEREKEEDEQIEENPILSILPTGDEAPKTKDVHNKRWAKVESLINSHNVNDWKQAIIESDIILDEMLEKMGYRGDTVAEKMKQIEESDFLTLNQAWEAHKMRNRIAHQGDYILSKTDADRAISLYRKVFEEFYFI